ncbi:MAG: hypothetical protein ACJ74W_25005 [Pyrinomonadaceae bacterium]
MRSLIARLACALLLTVATLPNVHATTTPKTDAPVEAKAIPAGEVTVVLPERLFNALIESLFTLPQPPTFPLSGGDNKGGACASEITLLRAQAGAHTGVQFRNGEISAPVAFKGAYGAPLVGCLKFQGWADTNLNLSFDQTKQALVARVVVREVHLSKVPSMLNNGITGLVQDALDARLNPVEILRADQVSLRLPLTKMSNSGALRLRAKEVRQEVAPGELRVHIVYEFVRED